MECLFVKSIAEQRSGGVLYHLAKSHCNSGRCSSLAQSHRNSSSTGCRIALHTMHCYAPSGIAVNYASALLVAL